MSRGVTARPLAGRTIVVTRSRPQASALSQGLIALGARVIEIPTIAIAPPESYDRLDAALRALAGYDWLIVTSANTARVLGERMELLGLEAGGVSRRPCTVAVGTATAGAMESAGFQVELVPEIAVAESIVEAIGSRVLGTKVLLARAAVARDILPEALAEAGAEVTVVDAYRTVLAEESLELVRATFGADLERGRAGIDALTFTSSSTVRNLAALLAKAQAKWPREARVISIGPVTSATLRELGVEPDREAARHEVEGLIAAVVESLSSD